ncbi:MAG TPA: ABC transporter permease [Gammaproteobacteria bacterium]|nr:ABC transporter permease [Gammaproteobacteria bacterium]
MRYRGFATLFYKEVLRFYKVALQTLLAPVVTTLLYLLVFSHALGEHLLVYGHIDYEVFLIPGLVMMTIIQNAFANSSSSLIQSKVTGNIVFVLLAPLSHVEFYLAFVLAAVTRGLLVGVGVYLVAIAFVDVPFHDLTMVVAFALLGSFLLATLGVIAGIWAEKFDQLAGFQNFLIMPLTFLSGVFYSIHSLPDFWQGMSRLNPFFYMIDGFRYGFFGVSDVNPWLSMVVVLCFLVALSSLTLALLRRGWRLRG